MPEAERSEKFGPTQLEGTGRSATKGKRHPVAVSPAGDCSAQRTSEVCTREGVTRIALLRLDESSVVDRVCGAFRNCDAAEALVGSGGKSTVVRDWRLRCAGQYRSRQELCGRKIYVTRARQSQTSDAEIAEQRRIRCNLEFEIVAPLPCLRLLIVRGHHEQIGPERDACWKAVRRFGKIGKPAAVACSVNRKSCRPLFVWDVPVTMLHVHVATHLGAHRCPVEPVRDRMTAGRSLFASTIRSLALLRERYSDAQSTVVTDFLRRNTERLREETRKLQTK